MEKATLLDKYKVTVNLSGQNTGSAFTVTDDMTLPFTFDSKSSAVLGVDFEVEGGVNEFTIAKGTNSASVILSSLDSELGDEKTLIMKVDSEKASARFLQGNNGSIEVAVKGILKLSSLLGKWQFVEVVEIEEIMTWAEDMEDDPELIPYKHDGYTFEITEKDGVYCFIP